MTAAVLLAVVVLGSCAREKGQSGEPSAATGAAVLPVPTDSPVPSAASTPLESARARAAGLEARAASFRADSGTWSAGDASSTYAVLLDGKRPVMLEEKLSLGERGASFSRFFYDNGRVFLYQERGIRMSTNQDRGYPMTVESRLEVEIAFDSSGKVVGSGYAEDRTPMPLPDTKATEVTRRAALLAEKVTAGRS